MAAQDVADAKLDIYAAAKDRSRRLMATLLRLEKQHPELSFGCFGGGAGENFRVTWRGPEFPPHVTAEINAAGGAPRQATLEW